MKKDISDKSELFEVNMKDPLQMSKIEKYNYIFQVDPPRKDPRFNWISNCLLGDIQTFLDGIENFIQNKEKISKDHLPHGGGNLSLPILISTALEFVSALYVGKTKYSGNYNATINVKEFIENFFPEPYNKFPLLLWDGIRNGIVHTFSPKPFKYQANYIHFQFFVEDNRAPSDILKNENTLLIRINAIEMYRLLNGAIDKYRKTLESDENLQNHFILAWSSIEDYIRNIDGDLEKSLEVKWILSLLENQDVFTLTK